jgi:hypothetical protein
LKTKRTPEEYRRYLKHWEDHLRNASYLLTLPCRGGSWVHLRGRCIEDEKQTEKAGLVPLSPEVQSVFVIEFFPERAVVEGKIEPLFYEIEVFFN